MGHTKVVFGYSSAPEGCDLDASLGGHAALTLIAMTRGLRNRSRSLASVECRMKTVDKASALEVDRLVQEADGSAVQRACLNRLVAMGRYENDWYVKAEMRQMMLQLYAAHVRQLHIQYQTPRFGHYRRLQKRLG
jgi:hypothetical protein